MQITFNNTYTQLPENFYTKILPVPVKNPKLIQFNSLLAAELGIETHQVADQELAQVFSGNKILAGSQPIALVYAGHQFGHFVTQLGDGRAILLGEVIDKQGKHRDIQLKGSGRTPYSRQGDGRAALGPIIREYIISEAMYALGIKTTRSLAMVTTGESVTRETILPGGILTRVAASHIRIGTFEYFAAKGDHKSLKILADYAINRHYSFARTSANPYLSFLGHVCNEQAILIANWMRVGFIHGVMNTDNTAISGETLDFGPCAFIDDYEPLKVFSSIDYHGRYSFSNQASICRWNLIQLGYCLAPLIDSNLNNAMSQIQQTISSFEDSYITNYFQLMASKIGIIDHNNEDRTMVQNLLEIMHNEHTDYTLTFRYLSQYLSDTPMPRDDLFIPSENLKNWIRIWLNRLQAQNISLKEIAQLMCSMNPVYIPRNHLIENAIGQAIMNEDFSETKKLIQVLANPYEIQQDFLAYLYGPKPHERVYRTFCGT